MGDQGGENGSRAFARTLSLAHDLYLDSHRLRGTPHMPMAMLLDQLCELHPAALTDRRVWVDELACAQPIFLRKDRDKTIRVEVRADGGALRVRWLEDDELTYAEGSVRCAPAPAARSRRTWGLVAERRLGRALYEGGLLPHGRHFQCALDLGVFGSDGVTCRLHDFATTVDFYPGVPLARLTTNPAAVDAGLQICALHHSLSENRLALPVRARALCLELAQMHGAELWCRVRRTGRSMYALTLLTADGGPALSCDEVELAAAREPLAPEIIEAYQERIYG